MIPPPRDAVIHQLAQDLLTRLNWAIERSSAPGIGDYYHIADTGLGHIKAALLHAQQVQRERNEPIARRLECWAKGVCEVTGNDYGTDTWPADWLDKGGPRCCQSCWFRFIAKALRSQEIPK